MANRPPRFPGFDYVGFNRYFLTICVDRREPVFVDIELGQFVVTQFLQLAARIRPRASFDMFWKTRFEPASSMTRGSIH
jgi:hypothetical protein